MGNAVCGCKAEVADLNVAVVVKEQINWFQVTVNDPLNKQISSGINIAWTYYS